MKCPFQQGFKRLNAHIQVNSLNRRCGSQTPLQNGFFRATSRQRQPEDGIPRPTALLAPRERLEQVAPVGGEEEEAAAWWWQVERPHFWDGQRRAADATASFEDVQRALGSVGAA